MGAGSLHVVVEQLLAASAQWQGLSGELVDAPAPSPGEPFQPTTAAISGVNAAVGMAGAAFAAQTRATAAAVAQAATGYTDQEATAQAEMSAVTQARIV